jgi:hypothetical protein
MAKLDIQRELSAGEDGQRPANEDSDWLVPTRVTSSANNQVLRCLVLPWQLERRRHAVGARYDLGIVSVQQPARK